MPPCATPSVTHRSCFAKYYARPRSQVKDASPAGVPVTIDLLHAAPVRHRSAARPPAIRKPSKGSPAVLQSRLLTGDSAPVLLHADERKQSQTRSAAPVS